MTHLNDIEKLAMEMLTPEERNILADRLWLSAHDGDLAAWEDDPEFIAEMKRRMKAVKDGTATLHSFDQAMIEVRARHK